MKNLKSKFVYIVLTLAIVAVMPNVLSATQKLPDLKAWGIEKVDGVFSELFRGVIKNIGDADMPGGFTCCWYVDGELVLSVVYPWSVEVGETVELVAWLGPHVLTGQFHTIGFAVNCGFPPKCIEITFLNNFCDRTFLIL